MKRRYCWTWEPRHGEGSIPDRLPPEERADWNVTYAAYKWYEEKLQEVEAHLNTLRAEKSKVEEELYRLHCMQCPKDCGVCRHA